MILAQRSAHNTVSRRTEDQDEGNHNGDKLRRFSHCEFDSTRAGAPLHHYGAGRRLPVRDEPGLARGARCGFETQKCGMSSLWRRAYCLLPTLSAHTPSPAASTDWNRRTVEGSLLVSGTSGPGLRRLLFAYDMNNRETGLPLHLAWQIEAQPLGDAERQSADNNGVETLRTLP